MSLADDYLYRVDLIGLDSSGASTTFRYATEGYCTTAGAGSSGIANATFVDGRLRQFTYRRDLYGEGASYGEAAVAHGEIVLGNEDGGLDGLLAYGFDSTKVEVWRIDPANLGSEICEFRGVTEQFAMETDFARVLVRDYSFLLATPLQTKKFAGTNALPNGLEGTPDDLQGMPKPIAIGILYNVKPPLVNTSRLIYQFHDVSVNTTGFSITVKDMGVALTRGADYTSQVDMETNAPTAGQFRVWSDATAGSFFRLGATPAGQLTADITNPPATGTATSEWNRCMQYLLSRVSPGWLHDNRITTVGNSQAGFFWTEEITVLDALRQIARCAHASMHSYPVTVPVFGGTPVLTTQRLGLPSGTADLELDISTIKRLERTVPNDDLRGIPPWRFQVGWKRNATVMARDALAGSVSASDVSFYASELRYVKADNTPTLLRYPRAQQMVFDTALADDPSTDLAVYFRTLFSAPFSIYTLTVPAALFDALLDTTGGRSVYGIELGKILKVTFPRFIFASGVNTMLIGYVMDYAAREAQLLVWVQQ